MQAIALAVFAVFHAFGPPADLRPQGDPRAQGRVEEAFRREGEALAAIADDALAGRTVAADIKLQWRNDFFKAQPGTFVPFTVTFEPPSRVSRHALLYIRAERLDRPPAGHPAYETIFPARFAPVAGESARLTRGFAVAPGRYRVVVVLRESSEQPLEPMAVRQAGVLVRELDVPDFWSGELAVSTIMLAERIEALKDPVAPDELDEDPYVVGAARIHPAAGRAFPRNRELVAAFLIYNPTVGADAHFDLQVDYHVYRKDPRGGAEDQYVTRTNPQRFNPSMMGSVFDPAAGTPILAGQAILLASFEPGEYRLEITVTDLLSRKSLRRDVVFAVVGL